VLLAVSAGEAVQPWHGKPPGVLIIPILFVKLTMFEIRSCGEAESVEQQLGMAGKNHIVQIFWESSSIRASGFLGGWDCVPTAVASPPPGRSDPAEIRCDH
jgi:hypothetical protein